jgi:hypothetical protein
MLCGKRYLKLKISRQFINSASLLAYNFIHISSIVNHNRFKKKKECQLSSTSYYIINSISNMDQFHGNGVPPRGPNIPFEFRWTLSLNSAFCITLYPSAKSVHCCRIISLKLNYTVVIFITLSSSVHLT